VQARCAADCVCRVSDCMRRLGVLLIVCEVGCVCRLIVYAGGLCVYRLVVTLCVQAGCVCGVIVCTGWVCGGLCVGVGLGG
jgi:hypothetical protein